MNFRKVNLKNKIIAILIILSLSVGAFAGCDSDKMEQFEKQFFGSFDTVTMVTGYTQSREQFDEYADFIESELKRYSDLFDIYNEYEGINNLKTINENAGIAPVEVSQEIIDMLKYSIEMYDVTDGKLNIAFGSVLKIWHRYREFANVDPENARLPSSDEIEEALLHCDINDVIIDDESNTVYLADPEMSLDVGGTAKGYATELVANAVRELGFDSALISVGGNVRIIGEPTSNTRSKWGIGIQNPDRQSDEALSDTAYLTENSVVSSGDYQRYFEVDGVVYHHIIDTDGYPGGDFNQVTIITPDSGLADSLSTAVFLMDYETGLKLVESYGAQCIWSYKDGTTKYTVGLEDVLQSAGATNK